MALLPFPVAAAKNTGAPKRLSACQKVYSKKHKIHYCWMLKASSGKTGLNQNVHKCETADFYLCICIMYV